MSYESKIEAAKAAVVSHNAALGKEGADHRVDPDRLIEAIKVCGGTSEARLAELSHEDILACMPGNAYNLKPRVLAKEIATIFRGASAPADDSKRPVSAKKADRMTKRELVEAFDPEDASNAVATRLAKVSKGQKFIVYADGRIVDTDSTLKVLNEIASGFPGRDDIEVGGAIKKVYAIGELPDNFADENPLYPGRPLRPDGTCDQTGRSWEGIPLNVRQLIRVAMDIGELKVSHEQAHNTMDLAVRPDAATTIRMRYRKAAVRYEELASTGQLPTLKVTLATGGSERKLPFPEGKRVDMASAVGSLQHALAAAWANKKYRYSVSHKGWIYEE